MGFGQGTWGRRGSEREPVELRKEGSRADMLAAGGQWECASQWKSSKGKGPEAELDLCKEHEQGAW